MSKTLPKVVIEHQRLIDRVKGIDMANYERLSKDSGVPVELIVAAVADTQEKPNLEAVEKRIDSAIKLGLSPSYINGLKDALKLMGGI